MGTLLIFITLVWLGTGIRQVIENQQTIIDNQDTLVENQVILEKQMDKMTKIVKESLEGTNEILNNNLDYVEKMAEIQIDNLLESEDK